MKRQQYKIVKQEKGVSNVGAACDMLRIWMGAATKGEYILSLERVKQQRTIHQNKLMWLWFSIIAQSWSNATGRWITPQNVKEVYCEMFLPVETPKGRVGGSTSGLSVEDFTEFLNNVQADAASEYGIELPSPEDDDINLWINEYSDED